MAKINWVFQNEVGTNLNRYIATNVATGEEVTFDLLRGGNISIVGTPLSAENLNSLITAINDLYDNYLSLDGGTMKGDINLNTSYGFTGTTTSGNKYDIFRVSSANRKVIVGGTYPSLELAGKDTRPTYNGNSLALYSDIINDTNTWREIKINGTTVFSNLINSGSINFVSAPNVTITNEGNGNIHFSSSWRGIQNNLTSTSTSDSLSAYQGKILNDKITTLQEENGIKHLGKITTNITTFLNTQTTSGMYSFEIGNYNQPYLLIVYTYGTGNIYQSIIYQESYNSGLKVRDRYYSKYNSTWYEEYNDVLNFRGKVKKQFMTTSTKVDPSLPSSRGLYIITTTHSSYGTSTGIYEADWIDDEDDSEEITFTLIAKTTTSQPGVNFPTIDEPYFTAQSGYTITKVKKILTYA